MSDSSPLVGTSICLRLPGVPCERGVMVSARGAMKGDGGSPVNCT